MTRAARPLVFVVAALGILLGTPGVAVAQSVNTDAFTYISDTADCAWVNTNLNDEVGRPAMSSVGTQDWFDGVSKCGNKQNLAQPWAIAVRQDLLKWNGSSWAVCNNGPWVQSSSWTHAVSTGFAWGSPPCGPGTYRSQGRAQSWNGAWHSWWPVLGANWYWIQ